MKLPKLGDLLSLIPDQKTRDVATMASGVVLLLGGRKVLALGTCIKGLRGLEERWRVEHDFDGTVTERWRRAVALYEQTHQDPLNRKLHVVGTPILLGGTAGLLIFPSYRPLWMLSASAFTFGIALRAIGDGVVEKRSRAFADDPLAYLAGPLSDLARMRKKGREHTEDGDVIDVTAINVRPSDPALA